MESMGTNTPRGMHTHANNLIVIPAAVAQSSQRFSLLIHSSNRKKRNVVHVENNVHFRNWMERQSENVQLVRSLIESNNFIDCHCARFQLCSASKRQKDDTITIEVMQFLLTFQTGWWYHSISLHWFSELWTPRFFPPALISLTGFRYTQSWSKTVCSERNQKKQSIEVLYRIVTTS